VLHRVEQLGSERSERKVRFLGEEERAREPPRVVVAAVAANVAARSHVEA
jgi:hypothetical protein